jgi:hypothetical protein
MMRLIEMLQDRARRIVRDEMKCRPHYAITRSAYLRGKAAALGMIFDRVDLDGIERIAEYMTNPTDES